MYKKGDKACIMISRNLAKKYMGEGDSILLRHTRKDQSPTIHNNKPNIIKTQPQKSLQKSEKPFEH